MKWRLISSLEPYQEPRYRRPTATGKIMQETCSQFGMVVTPKMGYRAIDNFDDRAKISIDFFVIILLLSQ